MATRSKAWAGSMLPLPLSPQFIKESRPFHFFDVAIDSCRRFGCCCRIDEIALDHLLGHTAQRALGDEAINLFEHLRVLYRHPFHDHFLAKLPIGLDQLNRFSC